MTQLSTTRRDLLRFGTSAAAYAAGATIINSGVALAFQAKGEPAPTSISADLAAAIAAYHATNEAADRYSSGVYDPARARYVADGTGAEALSTVIAESDRLNDETARAMCAVCSHPVNTAADLAGKLAFMVELQVDASDWLDELVADAQRLAGMEVA